MPFVWTDSVVALHGAPTVRLNLSPTPDYLLPRKLSCISLQYLQETIRTQQPRQRGPSQISDKPERLDIVLSRFFLSMLHAINILSYMLRKSGSQVTEFCL